MFSVSFSDAFCFVCIIVWLVQAAYAFRHHYPKSKYMYCLLIAVTMTGSLSSNPWIFIPMSCIGIVAIFVYMLVY